MTLHLQFLHDNHARAGRPTGFFEGLPSQRAERYKAVHVPSIWQPERPSRLSRYGLRVAAWIIVVIVAAILAAWVAL